MSRRSLSGKKKDRWDDAWNGPKWWSDDSKNKDKDQKKSDKDTGDFSSLLLIIFVIIIGYGLVTSKTPSEIGQPIVEVPESAVQRNVNINPTSGVSTTFTKFWVKNHKITEMWSGANNDKEVVSFGTTSAQFCSFEVVRPQLGSRLFVRNPYSNNYFWVDANAVGPVQKEPERKKGPKPNNQNCAEAIYE